MASEASTSFIAWLSTMATPSTLAICVTDDPGLVWSPRLVDREGQKRELWECKESRLLILLENLPMVGWAKRNFSVGRQAAMMAAPDSIIDQNRMRLISSDDHQ